MYIIQVTLVASVIVDVYYPQVTLVASVIVDNIHPQVTLVASVIVDVYTSTSNIGSQCYCGCILYK